MVEKLNMMSGDIIEENIEFIASRFPNCVVETKDENGKSHKGIDFDVLKQELSNVVIDEKKERYQMTWPDKKKSILLANSKINATLRPVKEKSVDFDNTKNIYIEGDNLDVLKLLRETYLNKIKMIYIDPPYNTGKDFVYEDNFSKSSEDYLKDSGQFDDQGNRLVTNSDSNGRFHTDWLNMMYPRLKVARDLLADDGVIFISIDDNEIENLRKLCLEIFGGNSFLAEFPRVTKKGGKSTDTYAKNHDYVLAIAKNINDVRIGGIAHHDPGFKNKDEYFDKRGPYKLNQTLDYNTLQYNKTMDYQIELDGITYVPGGDIELQKQRHEGRHGKHDWVWRWSKQKFEFGLKNGWIEISKSGRIYTKTYLNASIEKNLNGDYEIQYSTRTKPFTTLDFIENEYSNDNSNKEITKLMGSALFDYVKPTSLVKMLLSSLASSEDALIMDFFSGSATTAHAVMKLNSEDQGNRRFIMVQLPEICSEDSEAYKAGYKNICDIGEERIRRAGNKIKLEAGMIANDLDTGFRVFKLDSSNMNDIYYNPKDLTLDLLNMTVDNVKSDRSPLDLLFQVMLELGIELSANIKEKEFNGKKYYLVNDNDLIACFDDALDMNILEEIANQKPLYAVFKDSSFASDSIAINNEQIFKRISPDTIVKVI